MPVTGSSKYLYASLFTSHITRSPHTLFKSLLSLRSPHPPSRTAPESNVSTESPDPRLAHIKNTSFARKNAHIGVSPSEDDCVHPT